MKRRSEFDLWWTWFAFSRFPEKQVDDRYLKMEGRAIFDFAIRDVAQSIKNTIEESIFSGGA